MAVANCPSCGGPIEFKVGSSAVVICDFCRSIVARTDRGLQDLGKVAALIDTGSPLRRDLPGRYHGTGFRLVGRTQMKHALGGVWDEWYAAFDDGRWGWIAEAQGKYYVTFKTAADDVPPLSVIEIGGKYRSLVITEISKATIASAEGEIPWRPEPGVTYEYADLSGAGDRFGTIDYSEEPPLLFAGEQTTLIALGISVAAEPARKSRVKVEKLSCSRCGGALNLVAPDSAQRIVCPNCGAVHDIGEGNLEYLETVKPRPEAILVPLGQHGTIDGHEYIVAGFMERYVTFDQKYFWTEYLLFNPKAKSFAWLVDSDDHWSFVLPLNAGDVADEHRPGAPRTIQSGGKTYRIFSDATATVSYVAGEFYWKVEAGETARGVDYIAPPLGISKEISGEKGSQEINYSSARYMPPADVEKAFSVSGLPRPSTVGMMQPYEAAHVGTVWASLAAALLVVAIILGLRSGSQVFSESFRFDQVGEWSDSATTASGSDTSTTRSHPAGTGTAFTKSFTLSGGKGIEIYGFAEADNAWVYVSGDLFNEQSGMVESFELPIEWYEGTDGGEHWTEGNRTQNVYLSAVPPGTYSLRLEGQWEPKKPPPAVLIKVREGAFRWPYFIVAFVLISLPPIVMLGRRGAFETQRWSDAMFTPVGTRRDTSSSDSDSSDSNGE